MTKMSLSSRIAVGFGVGVLTCVAVAPAASAQVEPEYPPQEPTSAAGVCVGDIPFFQYQVDFGSEGEFVGRPMTITFVNPAGDDFVIDTVVPDAGDSAQVLWPGASENPPDWPGWVLVDGQWVESTDDPGAFTRAPGGVTVEFSTNPTLTTSVTYPPATAVCANPENPPTTPPSSPPSTPTRGGLATTGAEFAGLAVVGAGLVAGGAALVVASRRRTKTAA
jgi:hypothetical protein